jgi:lysophospholipase
VLAFDLRGQGGSQRMLPEPRKGHVDDFMEYVRDIETIINQVLIQSMPKPHFALAHSMGAAALLLALDAGEPRFERAVMLAPLTGLAMVRSPALAHAAAAALDFIALGTRYVPGGGATTIASRPFNGNRLTSDPLRYATMGETVTAHPHLAIGDPTIRWTLAMFETFRRFAGRDFGARIATPSLMLIPGADPLCDPHAAEALALRIRACQPIVIPGARHELLTERDAFRDQVLAAIDAFLPGETQVEDLVPSGEADDQDM